MVGIKFYGESKKDKDVVDAWAQYLDSLDSLGRGSTNYEHHDKLLITLLHKMSISLGYDFNEERIKNTSYAPHDVDADQKALIKGLLDILNGNKSVPIEIISDKNNKQNT